MNASTMRALAVLALGLWLTGCENRAIGRPCDVQADGGPTEASLNAQALECPTRLCLRQVKDRDNPRTVDTAAICTAECSRDSDCEDGETRNPANRLDRRCRQGFVCGVAVQVGAIACCRKVCLCRDFITIPATGLREPATCAANAPGRCPLQPE